MPAKFEPSSEQRYTVEVMAGIGIQQEQIAAALGISAPTLRKHFAEELAIGKTRIVTKVAESLVRQALAGNMSAAMFFLKCQAGWRDRPAEEPGKKEQREAIAATAERGTSWEALLN